MKEKDLTRLVAGGSLAGIVAVHWLPKRLLPFASPGLAALLILGGLLFVHRNPLKGLWRDLKVSVEEQLSSKPQAVEGAGRGDDRFLDQEKAIAPGLNGDPEPAP